MISELEQRVDVSVLIVCWNSEEYIYDCLKSIYHFTIGYSFEVIVVDNGSTDNTVNIIKDKFHDVRLFESGVNYGFARGNNIAISMAHGKFLFLLNPDTYLESNVIKELASFLETHPEVGAVTPKILWKNGTIDFSAVRELPSISRTIFTQLGFRKLFPKHRLFSKEYLSDWDRQTIRDVPFINGAAIMIPRSIILEIGLLDEQLPMYFEDLDLCARIKNTGKSLYYIDSAVLVHLGGKSADLSPVRPLLFALESGQAPWLYFFKYKGHWQAFIFTLSIFWGSLIRFFLFRILSPVELVKGGDYGRRIKGKVTKSKALLIWSLSRKRKFVDRLTSIFPKPPNLETTNDSFPGMLKISIESSDKPTNAPTAL